MASNQPILDIWQAAPETGLDEFRVQPITLRLLPGEFALIETSEPQRAAWFADLCCGFVRLAEGTVSFLGCDWTATTPDYAAALRGRIGRVFGNVGWIDFLDVATNVLLPQLHHPRRDARELREEAATLASSFGLPGLPIGHPRDLSAKDLARAACIRAFLGEPALLLLESPLQARFADLAAPVLEALTAARQKGSAAIWLTGSDHVWRDRTAPVTRRLRLRDYGLFPVRRAA